MSNVPLINSSLWQRLRSGGWNGMMTFTFSDTPLACFRKKFDKANWRDYQNYKVGP